MGISRAVALVVLIACAARADEYPAGRPGRYARFVKEPVSTDLSFLAGQNVPGVHVKRHRHSRYTEWSYWRDRWHVVLRVPHPPDELTSGQPYTVPLEVRVQQEGDDPLKYSVGASVRGLHRSRVSVTQARITKPRRGEPPVVEQGKLVFTPRLDWDTDEIGIEVAFTDGAGTDWVVARYAWWSNQLPERHRTPRRRDLDPVKP